MLKAGTQISVSIRITKYPQLHQGTCSRTVDSTLRPAFEHRQVTSGSKLSTQTQTLCWIMRAD